MTELLEEALGAGALGLSSGLFTAPGSYAEGEELVALGRVLRRHGARYFTHLRDESNAVFDSVEESIEFAQQTGVHVQIVHVKLSGMDNWGGAERLLDRLEEARRGGAAIDCDQYPYEAASNPLRNLFPSWLQQGGIDAMLERLGSADIRARVRAEVDAGGLNNFGRIPSWEAVRVSISPDQPQFVGRTVQDIAAEQESDPFEAALDYLVADRGQTRVLVSSISEDDIRTLIASPSVMVGSDGNAVAPYGTTGQGKPHPRFYGTFARILGRYVRELGLISIETAVHKMTGASARALGISGRGFAPPGLRRGRDGVRSGNHLGDCDLPGPSQIRERRRPGMGQRQNGVRRRRAYRRHARCRPRPRIGESGRGTPESRAVRVLYLSPVKPSLTGSDPWPISMSKV